MSEHWRVKEKRLWQLDGPIKRCLLKQWLKIKHFWPKIKRGIKINRGGLSYPNWMFTPFDNPSSIMKKPFFTLLILSSCIGLLSSCNRLFEVEPRGIYSPIELGAIKVSYTLDPYKYLNVYGDTIRESIKNSTLRFSVNDTTLKYGAVLFYDSLSAYRLVKNGVLTGVPEFYSAERISSRTEKTVKVRIDPIKGQFQYIVPVGYSKDSTRIYAAQGFVQTKISPWTRLKDLDFYSTRQYRIKLFQGNGRLAYLKYDQQQMDGYELDPVSSRWAGKFSFPVNVCKSGCSGYSYSGSTNSFNILIDVETVFYGNSQYRIIAKGLSLGDLYRYRIHELLLNQQFNYLSQSVLDYSSKEIRFYASDFQKDTLRLLYNRPDYTTRPQFPPIDFTILSGFYKSTTGSLNRWPITESLVDATISLFIGQKLVINSGASQSKFTVFDLSKGQFRNVGTANFTGVWTPASSRLIAIADGNQAYLLNSNLNLYRVTVKPDNTPVFENFYANWFPGNSANAISQGVLYQGKLLFLVNDYQLWEFDPSQLTIDFNRPGAVAIVSL